MGQWGFIKNIIKNTKKVDKPKINFNKITKEILDNNVRDRQLSGQIFGEYFPYGDQKNAEARRVLAEGLYDKERYKELLNEYNKFRNTLDEDSYIKFLKEKYPTHLPDANLNDAVNFDVDRYKRIEEILKDIEGWY